MKGIRLVHLQIALITLTIVLTGLSFTEIIARTLHADASRVNMYSNWFQYDYYQYLAGIVRGQHGLFWYRSFFTIPNPPVIPIYMLYQILGIVTSGFHIWSPYVYHAARILMIVFSVWTMYVLSLSVIKSKPWAIISTLIGLSITNPPSFLYNPILAATYNEWWTVLSAYQRINAQPHYLAARGLLCLSIAWYLTYRASKKRRYLIGSSIAATLCVFNVPHTSVPFFAIVLFGSLWDCIHTFRQTRTIRVDLLPLVSLLTPLVSIGILNRMMQIPLWITASLWERDFDRGETWTTYHYYISHVYILLPAYIGFIKLGLKKDFHAYALLVWILIPLLFSPFFYTLNVGGLRFDMFIYIIIPLSILTSFAIKSVMSSRFWSYTLLLYMSVVIVLSTYSTAQFANTLWRLVFLQPLYTNIFPPKEYMELAQWVSQHVPVETTLMASPEIGTLMVSQYPFFSYIGEQTRGSNVAVDTGLLEQFYSEQMTTEEALQFLSTKHITYVVQDPKFIWPLRELSYPFLTKVWGNSQTGIYQVKFN